MIKNKKDRMFVGYIPVIHDGYIKAFNNNPNSIIGILDNEILSTMDYIRKDIRALSPEDAAKAINGLGRQTIILNKSSFKEALKQPIVMPYDDISRQIIINNPDADITTEPIFLRWDRDNSIEKSAIIPDLTIKLLNNTEIIPIINHELSMSSNWWRHVGAVIFDDKEVNLSTHNSSLPTDHTSWIDSDPRITARKGESIERSIDIHAEARIIAEASRRGISLEGKSICVSTFPCPNCAKLIALSGIKTCYYIDGYSMLDGYDILKDFEVKIVKIDIDLETENPRTLKPYPISRY